MEDKHLFAKRLELRKWKFRFSGGVLTPLIIFALIRLLIVLTLSKLLKYELLDGLFVLFANLDCYVRNHFT